MMYTNTPAAACVDISQECGTIQKNSKDTNCDCIKTLMTVFFVIRRLLSSICIPTTADLAQYCNSKSLAFVHKLV